jgi:hypothetical protein
MQTTEEIPIELECWMLKHGILPAEDMRALYGSNSDIVWPKEETAVEYAVRTGTSMGWMPSYEGEEPPF